MVRFSPICTVISSKAVAERDEDRFLTSSSVVAGANPCWPSDPWTGVPLIPMRENTVSFFNEENFLDARASRISFGF